MNRLLCSFLAGLWLLPGGCFRYQETTVRGTASYEALPSPQALPGDWPWWRGPTKDGKSEDQDVPLTWSKTENVLWKSVVPGRGHSTPVVWRERIFLTTADEEAETQSLLCFDRGTGAQRWGKELNRGGFDRKHKKNSHASASPACDGERVYAVFLNHAGVQVHALDLDGNAVWQTNAGDFESQHGYGSSPVVYKALLIVNGDSLGKSFVAALHRKSGDLVWKTFREPGTASFATPMVGTVAGRPQLLLHGLDRVTSYNPDSGENLWYCDGPATTTASTVAFGEDHVFASGGYPQKNLLCVRADGSGDVTATHIEWHVKNRGVAYVPTPVVHEGHLYMIRDDGIATCFDAKTGVPKWTERLEGDFSASPILARGHFYVPNERGKVFVFKARPTFELVAENDLTDGGFASPVICGGRIYLRTNTQLYCIGKS